MDFVHAGQLIDSIFLLKVPLLEKIARPVLVYVALILLLRVFGKRELAQLSPFDLVVLLSLSNTVQNAIIGEDNSVTGGVIGAFSLLGVNYIVVRLLFRHKNLERMLTGSPTTLIRGGVLDEKAMEKETLSESELLTAIHRQGFDGIEEIETCRLEPSGGFFIKGKEQDEGDRHQAELLVEISKLQAAVAGLRADLQNRVN